MQLKPRIDKAKANRIMQMSSRKIAVEYQLADWVGIIRVHREIGENILTSLHYISIEVILIIATWQKIYFD